MQKFKNKTTLTKNQLTDYLNFKKFTSSANGVKLTNSKSGKHQKQSSHLGLRHDSSLLKSRSTLNFSSVENLRVTSG